MSPLSVSGVMAMVSAGARGNTLTQLMNGFSFPTPSSLQLGYQDTLPALKSTNSFTLEAGNTAFIKNSYSLSHSFQDTLENIFHTSFQRVNFERSHSVAAKINNWVKNITRDKIKNVIKPDMLDSDTRLVLINAIYFTTFPCSWATGRLGRQVGEWQEKSKFRLRLILVKVTDK